MPNRDAKIYREPDGMIAGVCSGFARFYDIDVSVVRLFAVILALLTGGMLVLVYLAMWLILPMRPEEGHTIEVKPESIESDVYGQVARDRCARVSRVIPPAAGGGHIPPVPPTTNSAVGAVSSSPLASASPSAIRADDSEKSERHKIVIALVLGITLVVLGFSSILASLTNAFTPLQCWPLLLVAFGIARMVVPGETGRRVLAFSLGLMTFCAGLVLLLYTLGIIALIFDRWIEQSCPLLFMAAGLFLLGDTIDSPVLIVLGAFIFVLFFAIGVMFYSVPGPLQYVWLPLPFDAGVSLETGY